LDLAELSVVIDVHIGEIQVPQAYSEPIRENLTYPFVVLPLLVTVPLVSNAPVMAVGIWSTTVQLS
jgi:hypothetical protein